MSIPLQEMVPTQLDPGSAWCRTRHHEIEKASSLSIVPMQFNIVLAAEVPSMSVSGYMCNYKLYDPKSSTPADAQPQLKFIPEAQIWETHMKTSSR